MTDIPYPLTLGLHSQTDIVAAINDLNARLSAIDAHPWTPALLDRLDECERNVAWLKAGEIDGIDASSMLLRIEAMESIWSAHGMAHDSGDTQVVDRIERLEQWAKQFPPLGVISGADGKPQSVTGPATSTIPPGIILNQHGPPVVGNGAGCLMKSANRQPAPDDETVVVAMDNAYQPACSVAIHEIEAHKAGLRAILAAIRAGRVPGVRTQADVDKAYEIQNNRVQMCKDKFLAEITNLKAQVHSSNDAGNIVQQDQIRLRNERDALKAQLASMTKTAASHAALSTEAQAECDQLRAELAEMRDRIGTKEDALLANRMADAARSDLAALLSDVASALGCNVDNEAVLHKAHEYQERELGLQMQLAEAKSMVLRLEGSRDKAWADEKRAIEALSEAKDLLRAYPVVGYTKKVRDYLHQPERNP